MALNVRKRQITETLLRFWVVDEPAIGNSSELDEEAEVVEGKVLSSLSNCSEMSEGFLLDKSDFSPKETWKIKINSNHLNTGRIQMIDLRRVVKFEWWSENRTEKAIGS